MNVETGRSSRWLAKPFILALVGAVGCGGGTTANDNPGDDGGSGTPDAGSDDGGGGGGDDTGQGPDVGGGPPPIDGGSSVQAIPLSSCIPTVYTAPTTIGASEVFQLLVDTGSTSLGVAA